MGGNKHGLGRSVLGIFCFILQLEMAVSIYNEHVPFVFYEKLVIDRAMSIFFLHKSWLAGQKSEMGKNICTEFKFSVSRESFLSIVWANDIAETHLCLLLLLELAKWRLCPVVSDNRVHYDSAICELLSMLLSASTHSVDLLSETSLLYTHTILLFFLWLKAFITLFSMHASCLELNYSQHYL